jgi:hypothetical protein
MGKSAGAGSLALWMHGLKSVELIDYKSSYYKGKAGKVGAGIQGYELNKAVADDGYVFMAGACASVGSAGGYTQGGGHSPLSNIYGLSADNVLEWEVVDGTGRLLTASPEENPGTPIHSDSICAEPKDLLIHFQTSTGPSVAEVVGPTAS